jgi:integrase/recombinase XerD
VTTPKMDRKQNMLAQLSWPRAIELFLNQWTTDHPGLRPATLDHYREQLETRLAAFAFEQGITTVNKFTRADLQGFKKWLDEYQTLRGPISQRGKQMALNCAKMLLRWAYQPGVLTEDVGRYVRGYQLNPIQAPRATQSDDLELLLSAFSPHTAAGIRNTAMVYLMALCGLRVSEVCGLNAGDLHPREGQLTVRSEITRGQRIRTVDLPSVIRNGMMTTRPEIAEALTAWLAIRARTFPQLEDHDPLFVTLEANRLTTHAAQDSAENIREAGQRLTVDAIRLVLRRAAERVGLDPRLVMPHRLRHHFGLSAAAAGVDQAALMRAMGHSSPLMTSRYAVVDEQEQRRQFARADITAGVRLPRLREPRVLTPTELDDTLTKDDTSLSEIARRLFSRE